MARSRRSSIIAAVLAGLVAASALAAAQTKPTFQTYKGVTVNLSTGAGLPMTIDVFRWASDAERERLLSVLAEKGDNEFLEALRGMPTAGYLWTDESPGYFVRYAYRLGLPDGGERVIVAIDGRPGSWTRYVWQAKDQPVDYPFTVIELRLNRQGEGEGKMSLAAKVVTDQTNKTIELEDYGKAPVLLKGVQRQPAQQSTS